MDTLTTLEFIGAIIITHHNRSKFSTKPRNFAAMHMAWMRQVSGRLESRYQYSGKVVYNNFPWPELPPALVKAHTALDRAVELCYRPQPFDNDRQRVKFLFALYEKLTAPLLPVAKKPRARRRSVKARP